MQQSTSGHHQNQWGNDSNDLKNLNNTFSTLTGEGDKGGTPTQERFIDKFYPFMHTARIEQLFVMESTTKEDLPKNLVTASESSEYVEFGVRYGAKEAFAMLFIFLAFGIWQFVNILKNPYSPNLSIADRSIYIALAIPVIYGLVYSIHLSKFNIGKLTGKVITALLVGRMIPVIILGMTLSYALWGLDNIVNTGREAVLKFAITIVPQDKTMYSLASNAASMLMMPFGGGFAVQPQNVAYAIIQIAPMLSSAWQKIMYLAIGIAFLPIIGSSFKRVTHQANKDRAIEELKNY